MEVAVSTTETVRLLIVGAAAGISVYAAVLSALAARVARRNLARSELGPPAYKDPKR
jgi:hypothetical protein